MCVQDQYDDHMISQKYYEVSVENIHNSITLKPFNHVALDNTTPVDMFEGTIFQFIY